MLAADFLLALPGAYLVLVLRGVLPPVLETGEVFVLIAALFALSAWPHAARGVRAIVASERARDYALAARAAGAGPWRLATRHLLPAARGFLAVEVVLLVPALLVAEATVSYLGLGFSDTQASWGTMMQDAATRPGRGALDAGPGGRRVRRRAGRAADQRVTRPRHPCLTPRASMVASPVCRRGSAASFRRFPPRSIPMTVSMLVRSPPT
jgi:hypothetical protein